MILPAQTTLLIGREKEVAEIRQLVADPQCRMLTLVGPGGIGKTRLAIEVASRLDGFADGVHFVALQPVASADLLVPAIATATGLPLAGLDPLLTQLLHNLRHKQMLLLLDNFEHLSTAANLLVEILQAAPGVKLLITSREAIGVREEWLYQVHGLEAPARDTQVDPARYGAVQLFYTRARQVRHDFRWEAEREAVGSICRRVEGNPLAVELAASWLTVLDSAAIAAQLRQGPDILASSLRDIPERHRSMRVVFDHSWQLLSQAERDVFARLTVFRGGFTLAAAQEVAGALLNDLSALVAKSLIRREADGLYHIHELLRQHGSEKLAAAPVAEMDTHRAYADHFIAFLNERRSTLDEAGQLRAVHEIAAEHENIYSAWHWSVDHIQTGSQAEALRLAVGALTRYHQLCSRYLEGAEILTDTIRKLESGPRSEANRAVLADCLIYDGWLAIRLGRPTQAEQSLTRVRHIYDQMPTLAPDSLTNLKKASMILALVQGDYGRAVAAAQEARLLAQEQNDISGLSLAHYGLASAALAQGEYEQARREAEQALALAESVGNRWLSITTHDTLGQIACALGELQTAKRHFEAAYSICAAFGAPGVMALHLKNLGDVAARQQQWPEARTLYHQSLERYQTIGDRGGAVTAERGLAIASYPIGDINGARRHFRQALDTAVATGSIRTVLSVLAAAGEFTAERAGLRGLPGRRQTLGLRILRFVAQHPSCDRTTHDEALAALKRKGAPPDGDTGDTLESLVAALQAELTAAPEAPLPLPSSHSLVPTEPLTAREVEVLKLLAEGCSNLDIANKLVVAVGTVKAHTSSIYRKLDATNRAQAVARAHELGLLE